MFGRSSRTPLVERLEALDAAADLGEGILPDASIAELRRVAAAGAQRRELSDSHTVVGFFGATGSGKTSLFNAVVGEDLGKAAARRPTTSSPLAAVWHPEGASPLLDWLGVEDRRAREGDFSAKAGPLILLDLPDFDSIEASNRAIAERLAGQVDVLVWVTDPEKYADAIIHQDFIRPYAGHAAVTLAVLNKADTLSATDLPTVTGHLGQLLADDGLTGVRVIATSAATGQGVDRLREQIAGVAKGRQAQEARIVADIHAVTEPLVAEGATKDVPASAKQDLDDSLATAAGAEHVGEVTAAAYRRRLGRKTGWLLTSWATRLKPDPLRRMGLEEKADDVGVHHSSRAGLTAADTAVANRALRGYAREVSEGLPDTWARAIGDRAEDITEDVPEILDRSVARTELPAQPSSWWGIFGIIQWLALLLALVGVGWYLVAAFLPGVLVPIAGTTDIPSIEGWPYPTLLILGGLLLGLLLGLLTSVFGGLIGAAVKKRTRRGIRKNIAVESARRIEEPLMSVRRRFQEFQADSERARS